MITYRHNCDCCAQSINCKIRQDLAKIAQMNQFENMDCTVQVFCSMFRNGGWTSGSCSTALHLPEPEVVTNCKEQCDFYDYCLNPIHVNDITALQIEAVKWQLPVTLSAMCRCLIKKENTDGNS